LPAITLNPGALSQLNDYNRAPQRLFLRAKLARHLMETETYEGRRLQKFVYKGFAPVTKQDQGTVWPASN
jgi:hypothetical protein